MSEIAHPGGFSGSEGSPGGFSGSEGSPGGFSGSEGSPGGGSGGPIRGVLLAAGAGTRLRPLTEVAPKPAVPLLDVPLGAFGLRMLRAEVGAGAVMNVSHLGPVAAATLGPLFPGLEIFDEGDAPLGTAGTLAALEERLDDRVVTVNGDLLTDLELSDLVATHERLGAPVTLAVVPAAAGADFEGRSGRFTRFIDRRAGSSGAPGLLYVGAAVLERSVLALVPEDRPVGLAEVVFRPLASRGELAYHLHEGYARDVGTLRRYLEASLDLLEGRPTFGAPGQTVEVRGGRAYLGPGAAADKDALEGGAIVLAGSQIEGRVRRAVVWPGEQVPAGEVVEDAIWFRKRAHPIG